MKKFVYKFFIDYSIELWSLIFIGYILFGVLTIASKTFLFFYFYIPLFLITIFLSHRVFYIFEDRILIKFLYRKETILFKDVEKVIYNLVGAGGSPPMMIFKTLGKKSIFVKLYSYFIYRFVLRDEKIVVMFLSFLKKSGLVIDIQCSEDRTRRLVNEISKLDSQ